MDRRAGKRGSLARLATALLCAAFASSAQAESRSDSSRNRFDIVVLDAGHGGEDEGARGRRGTNEKDLVLDVARRLAARLTKQGLRVVLTRNEDVFVPLERRTSVANDARADLFISIHANASASHKPRGIETYFVSLEASDASAGRLAERENQAFGPGAGPAAAADPLLALLGDMIVTEHVSESSEFARLAQQALAGLDPARSRGVKQAPFVVLMGVQMPASLIEIGFLSNSEDERALSEAGRRDALADALAEAVSAFGKRFDARRGVAGASAEAGG